MTVNVFEGARRIMRLLQVVSLLVVVAITWGIDPYVDVDYETPGPTAPFVRMPGGKHCDSRTDAFDYVRRPTKAGHSISIDLCFRAVGFSDGRRLVPYKIDGTTVWGNSPSSTEVTEYKRDRAAWFAIPDADQVDLDGLWWSKEWEIVRNGAVAAVASWFGIHLIAAVIGWIARGFMEIPSGRDHRPAAPQADPAG